VAPRDSRSDLLHRLAAGQVVLDRRPADLQQVLADALADVTPQAVARNLVIALDVPGRLPMVEADPRRLRQVLLNLLSNAVTFTPAGSVRAGAGLRDGMLEVTMTDTGIGIAPEALGVIFAEFRQADSSTTRRYGGTGLGLAISKRLVEAHGGTIGVESVEGTGSVFTVRLSHKPPG
jgi:signal transduction histidine kinase